MVKLRVWRLLSFLLFIFPLELFSLQFPFKKLYTRHLRLLYSLTLYTDTIHLHYTLTLYTYNIHLHYTLLLYTYTIHLQ